jgi:dTDP-glucose 4,6-dehydratase
VTPSWLWPARGPETDGPWGSHLLGHAWAPLRAECWGQPVTRLPKQDLDHILSQTGALWEDLRGQPIFLTGGTGFVGTWLLESLLWANDQLDIRARVVVLTRDPARFRDKAPHLALHPAVLMLGGDVAGFDAPGGRFPFIIHAATEPSFEACADRPLGTFDSDVGGTQRVLEFAREHGTRRLLFTSSGAIYGKQPPEITHMAEHYTGAPSTVDPGSAYGHAKRVSEFMSTMYGRSYGFDVIIARLFAFVGPLLPLDTNYAVGNFVRDVLVGGPVRISGDGTPYRSYLYAADLAIWLWTILLRGRAAYPYNVGSPHDLTIADLAQTVVRVMGSGKGIEVARQPLPGARPLRYVPDTARAEKELGLRPLIPVEEGIRRMSEWYRTRDLS